MRFRRRRLGPTDRWPDPPERPDVEVREALPPAPDPLGPARLVERVGTGDGAFMQSWHCEVPAVGVSFRVVREEWRGAWHSPFPTRHILEVNLTSAALSPNTRSPADG